MKLFCVCLFIGLTNLFVSCRKSECPDLPVEITLSGKDVMDAHLSSSSPDLNRRDYSVTAAICWTQSGMPYRNRGMFKFNYSQIPPSAKIKRAILTLYPDTTVNTIKGHNSDSITGVNSWVIQKITSDWDVNKVTWNSQPTTSTSNQLALSPSTDYKQIYEIDMTDLVKEEFENPSTAFGFLMKLTHERPYNSIIFASSENIDKSLLPKLNIEYYK